VCLSIVAAGQAKWGGHPRPPRPTAQWGQARRKATSRACVWGLAPYPPSTSAFAHPPTSFRRARLEQMVQRLNRITAAMEAEQGQPTLRTVERVSGGAAGGLRCVGSRALPSPQMLCNAG